MTTTTPDESASRLPGEGAEVLLGQGTPETAAPGCGPGEGRPKKRDYHHPAAGWGAAMSVSKVLLQRRELLEGPQVIVRMNHENGGFDCPAAPGRTIARACAWTSARTASSTRPGKWTPSGWAAISLPPIVLPNC